MSKRAATPVRFDEPVADRLRTFVAANAAEPELPRDDLVHLVGENTGIPRRLVGAAARYWASYPDEVDAEIAAADATDEAAERAWHRKRELLSG